MANVKLFVSRGSGCRSAVEFANFMVKGSNPAEFWACCSLSVSRVIATPLIFPSLVVQRKTNQF